MRPYETVTCPLCDREIAGYVPKKGDGSVLRLVLHATVAATAKPRWNTKRVRCPGTGRDIAQRGGVWELA